MLYLSPLFLFIPYLFIYFYHCVMMNKVAYERRQDWQLFQISAGDRCQYITDKSHCHSLSLY